MAEFLSSIGAFFTQSVTWMSELLTTIANTPALAVVVFGMAITGFVVGLLSRLIRVG